MNATVNVFAKDWCDLVFEKKNKAYGAFELRQISAKNHLLAIFLSIGIFTLGLSTPLLIKAFTPASTGPNTESTVLINVTIDPPEVIKPPQDMPQPQMRRTIQFVVPEISTDPSDPTETPVIESLLNTNITIAAFTQEGSDDPTAPVELIGKPVTEEEEKPIAVPEQNAEFPGGEETMRQFIKDNLKYPAVAMEMGITGKVIFQFVVDKTGRIDQIKMLRGIGAGCDEEALRVVKLMPSWKPGKQNGKPVAVYFTLPISFTLVRD